MRYNSPVNKQNIVRKSTGARPGVKRKKKRRLRKGVAAVGALLLLAIIALLIHLITNFNIHFIGVRSANEDAKKYKEKHCLVFYPEEMGKDFAESLCTAKTEEEGDRIYDYELSKAGDYLHLSYPGAYETYLTRDFKEPSLNYITDRGKQILSDRLRYAVKKNYPDTYFSAEFLEDSFYEALPADADLFSFENGDLIYHEKKYGFDVRIPLKYMQNEIGMDFGLPQENYIKERYLDPERPMVALTFDDGPYSPVGQGIIDTLYRYDCNATFFVVGNRLSQAQMDFMKISIERGNQYGSHTSDHANLTEIDIDSAVFQVMDTVDYIKDHLGYQMTVYRSPYGAHNPEVSRITGLRDVLWNVDSLDWSSHDTYSILEEARAKLGNNRVILFHELYSATGAAIDILVPELVSEGYQLVTIDELMDRLDFNSDITTPFYGK